MTNETTHSRNHLGGRPLRLVLSAAPAHTSIRGRMTSRGVSVDLEFGSKDQHQFEIVVPASVEAGLTVGLVV